MVILVYGHTNAFHALTALEYGHGRTMVEFKARPPLTRLGGGRNREVYSYQDGGMQRHRNSHTHRFRKYATWSTYLSTEPCTVREGDCRIERPHTVNPGNLDFITTTILSECRA